MGFRIGDAAISHWGRIGGSQYWFQQPRFVRSWPNLLRRSHLWRRQPAHPALGEEVAPFYEWLSDGQYSPVFTVGGTVQVPEQLTSQCEDEVSDATSGG